MSADGAAIMVASLNAQMYPRVADELNVKIYPAFAFFPRAPGAAVGLRRHVDARPRELADGAASDAHLLPSSPETASGQQRIGGGMLHPSAWVGGGSGAARSAAGAPTLRVRCLRRRAVRRVSGRRWASSWGDLLPT